MPIYTFAGNGLPNLQDINVCPAWDCFSDTKYTFSRQCHHKTNQAGLSDRRESTLRS
jgi:hypothetical protein